MDAKVNRTCAFCGEPLIRRVKRFCSAACAQKSRRRFDISADELQELLWTIPTTKIAELFGVSDKAIEKRCHSLGLAKPPRGYWAIVKAVEAGTE